jgi:hypothetical protein
MMISCPCPQIDARIEHQVSCFVKVILEDSLLLTVKGNESLGFLPKGRTTRRESHAPLEKLLFSNFFEFD